jgi:hypothetical protein
MGKALRTNTGRRGMGISYWQESLMERATRKTKNVGGCIILGWILVEIGCGYVDWFRELL